MGRPSLSVCIAAQDCAALLEGLLRQVVPLADEVLVVDGGSRDETPEVAAAQPGVRLFRRPFTGDLGGQKNFLLERARGDWILVVDTDERLGDRLRAALPRLLRTRRYTHYKFPRYWLVAAAPWRHVVTPKHYPDWQLRLFRNLPQFRYVGRVHHHFPRSGRGPGRKLRRLHLFHFAFLLADRAAREAKLARYACWEPETVTTSRMVLWEDFPAKIRRCREPLTGAEPQSLWAGAARPSPEVGGG